MKSLRIIIRQLSSIVSRARAKQPNPENREPPKNFGQNLRQRPARAFQTQLLPPEKTYSPQARELTPQPHNIQDTQALESDPRIPPHQRHSTRHATARPQEHKEHTRIHAPGRRTVQGRTRIHQQSSQDRKRHLRISRRWLRVRLRLRKR